MQTIAVAVFADQSRRCRIALGLLLQACDKARTSHQSLWDFAVEIHRLQAAGVTHTDLRHFICQSLVEHAQETTSAEDPQRCFVPARNLGFSKATCFVLTGRGETYARRVLRGNNGRQRTKPNGQAKTCRGLLPCWDGARRQLRVGAYVVKTFRQAASRQVAILEAFARAGWPMRVENPLSGALGSSARQILRYTIENLNRNQLVPAIHFFADGAGRGVCWEIADVATAQLLH